MKVVHDIGGRVYFYSPFRHEEVPSFTVSRRKNTFKDWGKDNTDPTSHGSIIDLVMALENKTFKDAIATIAHDYTIEMPPKFEVFEEKNELPGILVVDECKIKNKGLIEYIRGRNIDVDLCSLYCKELNVRFPYSKTNPDKLHRLIGFPNDSGGYEVRNDYLKLSTRPKHISTIAGAINDEWMVFEGFFDFLSALQWYEVERLDRTAVVLNTLSFMGGLHAFMAENKMNWMYLDNDTAGQNAIGKMEVYGIPFTDCKWVYDGYKDFNDMWVRQ